MTPYTDGHDWMLSQATVDFRNEERHARNEAFPDPSPDPSEYAELEHEQLELATNGLDGNGDLLPELTPYQRGETSQLGPDDDDWGGF